MKLIKLFTILWGVCSFLLLSTDFQVKAQTTLAQYPLLENAQDATENNGDMQLINTPFVGGIYSQGNYIGITTPPPYPTHAITPDLTALNFNNFDIRAKFMVSEFLDQPVFVGGDSFRWIGFELKADGKIGLLYNNANRETSTEVEYQLHTWHEARVTYDGMQGKLFIDNREILTVAFAINPGGDPNVGITNFSNADVFRGSLQDLRIYNDAAGSALIAQYPLLRDAQDATGNNGDMQLTNTPFVGGIYSQGNYIFVDPPYPTHAITPNIGDFDFNNFEISAKFMVSEFLNQPVFIGGNLFRWIGFELKADGKIGLLYNNSERVSSTDIEYQLHTWHEAKVTYDGSVGRLFIDNREILSQAFTINTGSDTNVGITNFSNGTAFRGSIQDLRIFNPGGEVTLIAHYPLLENPNDITGNQGDMQLTNTPYIGGVYAQGNYIGITNPPPYPTHAITPNIASLDFNNFGISAKFMVSEFLDQPVFVGGDLFRWIGFYLEPDGRISLLYNNNNRVVSTNIEYQLHTWHEARVTYDGTIGTLMIDNRAILSVPFNINPGGDGNVGITNFSNADVLRGSIQDLVIVSDPDLAPRVIKPITDSTLNVNGLPSDIDLSEVFQDPDGDALNFSIIDNDAPSLLDAALSGNLLTLTPQLDQLGTVQIIVEARANGLSVTDTFTVNVVPADNPPIVVNPLPDLSVEVNSIIIDTDLNTVFEDPDEDVLSFEVISNSDTTLVKAIVNETLLSLVLEPDQFGSAQIVVQASSNGLSVTDTFNIDVLAPDLAPELISPIPDTAVFVNSSPIILSLDSYFQDPNEDPLNFRVISNSNPTLIMSNIEGSQLSLTPQTDQLGEAEIIVQASANELSATDTFLVNVLAIQTELLPVGDFNIAILSSDSVELTWTDNNSIESGYRILRREGELGDFIPIDSDLEANGTSYIDIIPNVGEVYFYRIQTLNEEFCNQACQDSCLTCTAALGLVTGVPTALEDPILSASTSIYPNPSKGKFTVHMDNNYQGKLIFRVIDVQGKLIYQSSSFKNQKELDFLLYLKNQHPGKYFLQIQNEDGYALKTLIKK